MTISNALRTSDLRAASDTVAEKEAHPLFAAFRQAQHGQLLIAAPDGQTHLFNSKKPGPEAYMRLKSWEALDALLARGEIGFAEAYIAGLWDSHDLASLVSFGLLNTDVLEQYFYGRPLHAALTWLKSRWQANTLSGSRRNILKHYDLGNKFYALWLDKSMTYSCALFNGNRHLPLEEAQAAKYRRLLDKLNATPGAHILEIGCGWGGFAEAAAQKGFRVTAVTISKEQQQYALERIRRAGLKSRVNIELVDYRRITGQFDHIVSIGMFEHVGKRYWPTYFKVIRQHLKPGGKALIQSIALDDEVFERTRGKIGFIETYIFPGGFLPSKTRFRAAAEKAGLRCHEMFGFGADYAITLRQWRERFEAAKDQVRLLGYNEDFMRMWRFYYAACIASFETKRSDVMQAELMQW